MPASDPDDARVMAESIGERLKRMDETLRESEGLLYRRVAALRAEVKALESSKSEGSGGKKTSPYLPSKSNIPSKLGEKVESRWQADHDHELA